MRARARRSRDRRGQRPRGDHRHRDPVPGQQGAADREDRRAGHAKRRSRASASCATSPTRTACASSSSSSAAKSAEVVLNNLYHADAAGDRCSASTWSRSSTASPKLLEPQGDARSVRAPPPRSRHAPHDLRSAQGARARAHPRRPDGRAGQHRRDDRADQDLAERRPKRATRMLARTWEPGAGRRDAGARRRRRLAARRTCRRSSACIDGGYQLTEVQAQAILDMRLHRLTGLEQDKITDGIQASCSRPSAASIEILAQPGRAARGDPRPSCATSRKNTATRAAREIRASEEDLDIHDLIAPEDVVVTLSHAGYAKRQPVTRLPGAAARRPRARRRRRSRTRTSSTSCSSRNTHDTLLSFTSARQGVLAAGVPAAARRPGCARQARSST